MCPYFKFGVQLDLLKILCLKNIIPSSGSVKTETCLALLKVHVP